MSAPTALDIGAAAVLLGVDPKDVPVLVHSMGQMVPRTIAQTAGDLPCEDCGAAAHEPCDMTKEH